MYIHGEVLVKQKDPKCIIYKPNRWTTNFTIVKRNKPTIILYVFKLWTSIVHYHKL